MKKPGILILTALMVLMLLSFSGCGKQTGKLSGKWAYIHDPETAVLTLKDNGKAVYKGKKYTYTFTDDHITFSSKKDEDLTLRYYKDDKEFYLYEPCEYTYMDDGMPESIVGNWYDYSTKWSYEFTDNGTFKEDGYFPGFYTVDEEAGSVKLVYNDHFYDTTLYFYIEGDTLHVEYPWSMVTAQ